MNPGRTGYSHVLITRPRADADSLAARLSTMGIESIVQPAQAFEPRQLSGKELSDLEGISQPKLLIFTSPRAVEFGLPQLTAAVCDGARYAAIGPATAHSLKASGRPPDIVPSRGFTSEALLQELSSQFAGSGTALVICAPGGRQALVDQLGDAGWDARPVWVYERRAAEISEKAVTAIGDAERLLTVFTSGDAMNVLSQRLPPAAWYAICRGDWLVISERLQRLARAFGPSGVHLASGPQNTDLAMAIRSIY